MTPAEVNAALEPLHRLGAAMSRAWPEMRAGRPVDAGALEAAARAAHASVDALDRAKASEIVRSLSARVARCEDDLRQALGGMTGFDVLALRSELRALIGESAALADRLSHLGTDRAA
jgi:hypothetical protein